MTCIPLRYISNVPIIARHRDNDIHHTLDLKTLDVARQSEVRMGGQSLAQSVPHTPTGLHQLRDELCFFNGIEWSTALPAGEAPERFTTSVLLALFRRR
jgi:hypothetical protein